MHSFEVGQRFPLPLVDNAAWWNIHSNVVVVSGNGMSKESKDSLRVDRVWLTAYDRMIGLTFTVKGGWTAEVVGVYADPELVGGEAGVPDWIIAEPEASTAAGLLMTVIWVEDWDKSIVHMQVFTLSAHLTAALRRHASLAWDRPLSRAEAAAAIAAWQARFPGEKDTRTAAFATCRPGG